MKTTLIIALVTLGNASAHISYTNRDLGTFSPGNEWRSSIKSGTISSTFGWAYSTDDDLGDSHRNRAFRFTLLNPGQVTLSVQRAGSGNILLPALSIYSGLVHIAPEALAHDSSDLSLAQFVGMSPKQGSFNALGDWSIGNDDVYNLPGDLLSGIAVPASLRTLTYQGNIADGDSSNFGSAAAINGDGIADGYVTGSFNLAAGDYTIMVGGGSYLTTPPAGPYASYGVSMGLSVVPEPSALTITVMAGAALVIRRRRK